jgi:hypothetical protein
MTQAPILRKEARAPSIRAHAAKGKPASESKATHGRHECYRLARSQLPERTGEIATAHDDALRADPFSTTSATVTRCTTSSLTPSPFAAAAPQSRAPHSVSFSQTLYLRRGLSLVDVDSQSSSKTLCHFRGLYVHRVDSMSARCYRYLGRSRGRIASRTARKRYSAERESGASEPFEPKLATRSTGG